MGEIITTGEDEPDLRKRFARSGVKRYCAKRKMFVSFMLTVVAASLFVLVSQSSIALAWNNQKSSENIKQDTNSICLLRQDFEESFDSPDKIKLSSEWQEKCDNQKQIATEEESPDQDNGNSRFEDELHLILVGYPMDAMVPDIAKQDRKVAAFLIGIAKKESDWGKHVPKKSGQDCYNYWGYKGQAGNGSALGYACFATLEEAVATVGGRLNHFVYDTKRDTPEKMLIWKCGNSCVGHSPEGVRSWVGSVSMYYQKIVDSRG